MSAGDPGLLVLLPGAESSLWKGEKPRPPGPRFSHLQKGGHHARFPSRGVGHRRRGEEMRGVREALVTLTLSGTLAQGTPQGTSGLKLKSFLFFSFLITMLLPSPSPGEGL